MARRKYSNLVARIFGAPLCILPEKADDILTVLAPRIGIIAPKSMEDVDDTPARESYYDRVDTQDHMGQAGPGIAVIPVLGTTVARSTGMEALSGMTSYAALREEVSQALADPRIGGVLLDIDSPGGEAAGMLEFSDWLHSQRGAKPIWAHANHMAASAGYGIASAADRVIASPDALVGSIGTIAMHLDRSEANAKQGLRYTVFKSGDLKDALSPHKPLDSDGADFLRAMVGEHAARFHAAVARNRRTTAAKVDGLRAAVFTPADAKRHGLTDATATFEDALVEFAGHLTAPSSTTTIGNSQMTKTVKAMAPEATLDASADTQATEAQPTPEVEAAPEAEAAPAEPAADAAVSAEKVTTGTPAAQTAPTTAGMGMTAQECAALLLEAGKCGQTELAARMIQEGRSASAVLASLSSAKQITDLCAKAKAPHLAAGFIASGQSVEAVRASLFDLMAARDDAGGINTNHQGGAGPSGAARPGASATSIWEKRRAQVGPNAR